MLKYIKILFFSTWFVSQISAQILDTTLYNGTYNGTVEFLLDISSNKYAVCDFGNNRVISVDFYALSPTDVPKMQIEVHMSYMYSKSRTIPLNIYHRDVDKSISSRIDFNITKSANGKKLIVAANKLYIIDLEGIENDFVNTGLVNLETRIDTLPIKFNHSSLSDWKYALDNDTLLFYGDGYPLHSFTTEIKLFNLNTKLQIPFTDSLLFHITKPINNVFGAKVYFVIDVSIKKGIITSLVNKRYFLPLSSIPDFYENVLISNDIRNNTPRRIQYLQANFNSTASKAKITNFLELEDKKIVIGINKSNFDSLFNKPTHSINIFKDQNDNFDFGIGPNHNDNIYGRTVYFEYHNGLLFYQYRELKHWDSLFVINPNAREILFRKSLNALNRPFLYIIGNGINYSKNRLFTFDDYFPNKFFYIFPSFPFPKDLNQRCLDKTGTIELYDETQNSTFNFKWKDTANKILPGTTKTSIKYQTNGTLLGDTLIMTYTSDKGLVGTNKFYYSFKPTAKAPLDTVLYCNPKKKLLRAKNVNLTLNDYKWDRLILNNRFNLFDTINALDTGSYRLTVIRKSNGCANFDTVKVNPDFTPAIGSVLPNQKLFISCKDTITNVLATSNKIRAKLYWRNPNLNNNAYANPLQTKITGNYTIVTLDTVNGCRDSSVIVNIANKKIAPNASIVGSAAQITSLTCNAPSIILSGTSTTAGTIFKWVDNNRNVYTNPITIASANGFKLFVTDTALGCIDSSQFRATILNKAKPQFINFQKQHFITCDDVGITISATTTLSGQTFIEWTDIGDNSYPNPFTTASPGKYFVTAIDNVNGCANYDTVNVTLVPTLKFTVSNDTTICRGGTASLKASYNSPLNYTWSTGATSSSINVQPTGTATYIVTGIKTSNGCTGKDTITVSIADTVAIVPLAFKPCDPVSTTGTIKINATGGIPPLKYSINNGLTFNINNNFNNTPFGTYTIIVKDSIGCTYNSSVLLNSTSILPIPNFIVPSNAVKGDTIVFVDITDPRPDSVKWTFPSNIALVNDTNKFSPVVLVKDIGTAIVKVTAFYPGCQVPFTRTFNFGAADTNTANQNNSNGIESVSVSPNPNNSIFDLEIKLYKKQNFAIFISNISTNFAQQLPTQFDSKYFMQNITLNTNTPGTYVIRVIAEFGTKQIKFVVN